MKNFYLVVANTFIASVTNFTVWFALVFFTYLQTQSVFATSVISGIFLTATAITGIWFGSLVDHYKKKQVMLWSSVFSLMIYIIGFIVYLMAPDGAFTTIDSPILWAFVTLVLLGVIAGNIRNIALPTLVTIMVPEDKHDRANGLVGTVSGVGFLITSVISGLLVGRWEMMGVFILAISLTLGTIIHLLFSKIDEKGIVHVGQENQPKKIDIRGTMAVISKVPGLTALILFTMFNNFLGGVFMALMDAYGLSLVSVEVWGLLWGGLSTAFIIGGLVIAKFGLGKNPLHALFMANFIIWGISCVFTIQPSIILLSVGAFIYLTVVPYIEAAEHTIIQKVVPAERQGRVFGFAHSVEQAASPLTAFAIGPIAQFFFIPFMTDGLGADLIGGWFGTGANRGIALVFTVSGIIGLISTIIARNSKYYRLLSAQYQKD